MALTTLSRERLGTASCRTAFYNAGVQIFDVNDPEKAESVAYFVPRFSEDVVEYARGNLAHGIYVEYDRNIIWLFTNHGFYALSGQQARKQQ